MPASSNINAYTQHVEAMTKALEAENGVRVKFTDRKSANTFRRACYSARNVMSKQLNGRTGFEELNLTVTDTDNGAVLIISRSPPISIEQF